MGRIIYNDTLTCDRKIPANRGSGGPLRKRVNTPGEILRSTPQLGDSDVKDPHPLLACGNDRIATHTPA